MDEMDRYFEFDRPNSYLVKTEPGHTERIHLSSYYGELHSHFRHGQGGQCPTCGAEGRFDIRDTPEAEFKDAIWFNPYTSWECYDCWLK